VKSNPSLKKAGQLKTMSEIFNIKFDIGDKVVHPQHGVGFVANIEVKQFEPNVSRTYYVVLIPDTTLWVPVDSPTSGLRRLSARSDLDQCRLVLQSAPLPLKSGRDLLASLAGRINQGSIVVQCEVVRDLKAYGWRKPLYGPIAEFQGRILDVLCQEWAAIEELPVIDASHEISILLKKGKAAHMH